MKKIVLTGGGTGGHVTPNIALIEALKKEDWDIHYLGTREGKEYELITAIDGVTFHCIKSGKLRRYLSKENITDVFKVIAGFFQSASLIRKLKPDVVFAKGGFVSVPVVYGAKLHGIPTILHESDMSLGLANKLSLPCCKVLCTTFPEAAKAAGSKGVVTGTPMRSELFRGSRDKAAELFDLDINRPVLMITGGSSGAQAINNAVRAALDRLTQSFEVLHICGKGNLDPAIEGTPHYHQFEYLNAEMPHAYAAADVIISRAGSNTLCEIIALHKPALLIPYPKGDTSRGDQIDNARSVEKRGLCRVLMQDNMNAGSLYDMVMETYKNRGALLDAMEHEDANCDGVNNVMKQIHKYCK